MKAMMMSIRPKHVKNILNCIKTLEIRKKFPKDYVGWVYIYCTLGQGLVFDSEGKGLVNSKLFPYAKNCPEHNRLINGKVVARFWCDKVEEIPPMWQWRNSIFNWEKWLIDKGCVSQKELFTYLKVHNPQNCGYAIHITKLEIFDKPKEISEFKSKLHIKNGCKNCPQNTGFSMPYCATCDFLLPLNRAPQSYQFIEI